MRYPYTALMVVSVFQFVMSLIVIYFKFDIYKALKRISLDVGFLGMYREEVGALINFAALMLTGAVGSVLIIVMYVMGIN